LTPITKMMGEHTAQLTDHDAAIKEQGTKLTTLALTVEGALTLAQGTAKEVTEIKKKIEEQFAKPVQAAVEGAVSLMETKVGEFEAQLGEVKKAQANMKVQANMNIIASMQDADEIKHIATRIRFEFPERVAQPDTERAVNEALQMCNGTLDDLDASIDKTYDPQHLSGTVVIVHFKRGSEARKQVYNTLAPADTNTKKRASLAKYKGQAVLVKMLKTKRELSVLSLLYEGKKKLQQDTGVALMVDVSSKTVKDQSGKVRAFVQGDSLVMPAA